MSFEIRPTETFWNHFRELPIAVQEGILDVLDAMRDHPGSFIQRDLTLNLRSVGTKPMRVESEDQSEWFSILFQYDADEQTLHIYDVIAVTDPPDKA